MAGAVAMQDSMGQYGMYPVESYSRYNSALSQVSPDPVYRVTVGTGPYAAAQRVLGWKGIGCGDWNAMDDVARGAVVAQYYNAYGLYADALAQRAFVAAIDVYCSSACVTGDGPAIGAGPLGAAGQAQDPNQDSPAGAGNEILSTGTGKDVSSGSTTSSSSISPSMWGTIGAALGTLGTTVQNVVNSNNEVDKARISAAAQTKIAQLQAANAQTNDAATQAANAQQISALSQLQAALAAQHQGLSTAEWLMIAAGALVVVGGVVYFAGHRRRNPVGAFANPVVRRGPKHRKVFVSAAHLRRKHRK